MPQRISQQQLEFYLWGAAVLLRGTIDAGDGMHVASYWTHITRPVVLQKALNHRLVSVTAVGMREHQIR